MLIAIIAGIIVGFLLAIPPGPVAVTIMRISMDKGLKLATITSLGIGLMDFCFCLAIIFATSAILILVNSFFSDYPIILLSFQIFVVASIILYGIFNIKTKEKQSNPDLNIKHVRFKFLDNLSHKGPFLLGIALAMSNFANPTFLTALAYVTMNIQKYILTDNSSLNLVIFAFGFGIGNYLWLNLIAKILVHYKERMSARAIARVHQFAGVTLIGFGTILGYRIITLTHWPEVIRLVFAF